MLGTDLNMRACERCGDVYARTGLTWDDETRPFICDVCEERVRDALADALLAADALIVYLDAAGLPRIVQKVRAIVREITDQ